MSASAVAAVSPVTGGAVAAPTTRRRSPVKRLIHTRPGWPVVALLAGYPIWWALGFGVLVYPLLAVPMFAHLLHRRPIKLPPGFGLWVLFLAWQLLAIPALALNPPGTVTETVTGRLLAVLIRLGSYLAVTVMLLYIGNLSEKELPRQRLVKLLAWMFIVTVAGGLLGVLSPTFNFTSPLELVLPHGIRANTYVQNLVHPASSQVQDVLGYSAPRPKAPFEYTNAWGNNVSLFAIWFVTLVVTGGLAKRRALKWLTLIGVLSIAALPIIYSLNRGMWIGVGLSAIYVTLRLAARRNYGPLGAMVLATLILGLVVMVTPLKDMISSRLQHGHSNQVRSSLSVETIGLTNDSPILGYGSTRTVAGSADSIAVGRSSSCAKCGNFNLGSNGQLWQAMIAGGYASAGLYMGLFAYLAWRYRRDHSAIGIAGSTVMLLALFYSLVYNAFPTPIAFYFLALALLWRNEMDQATGERRTWNLGPRAKPGIGVA
ncbi:MAG: hypothetical protein QOI35_1579 [Cryptosporangiaceae bacterium]|nr:hypothetical protein [Cryptosporangiaceae bacterium]